VAYFVYSFFLGFLFEMSIYAYVCNRQNVRYVIVRNWVSAKRNRKRNDA